MTHFICMTCGTQFAATATPPTNCPICDDERQYTGHNGQRWTTMAELCAERHSEIREVEPGLIGIGTTPSFAIGQRALLVETPGGNILWDCLSLLDDATIAAEIAIDGFLQIVPGWDPPLASLDGLPVLVVDNPGAEPPGDVLAGSRLVEMFGGWGAKVERVELPVDAESGSVTSAWTTTHRDPAASTLLRHSSAAAGSLRKPSTRSCPAAASRSAVAAPMPRVPPVTSVNLRSVPVESLTAPASHTLASAPLERSAARGGPRG